MVYFYILVYIYSYLLLDVLSEVALKDCPTTISLHTRAIDV